MNAKTEADLELGRHHRDHHPIGPDCARIPGSKGCIDGARPAESLERQELLTLRIKVKELEAKLGSVEKYVIQVNTLLCEAAEMAGELKILRERISHATVDFVGACLPKP